MNFNQGGLNTVYTLGGSQSVTFLTEKGLYKVLFKSRKPIADKLQDWVCDVIKDGVGQYDKDNRLCHSFTCKYDCIKIQKMSDKTLDKAQMYEGHYYRYIGSKVQMV
jgi:prophage antirepressor-like protein